MAYTTIDIGAAAADYGSYTGRDVTWIGLANSCNATGVLTSFEVWVTSNSSASYVFYWGTFSGSSTSYTSRDVSSDLGQITAGSKQTFTGQNVDCSSGDFIGFYANANIDYAIERNNTGGAGAYYKSGNQFGAGTQTYSASASRTLAVYATGVTVPDAPTSVAASDDLSDKVTITWTAGTGETDGHRVYRDGADVSGVVAHGTATYNDTPSAGTYAYTVKAINAAGLSAASTADNGTRTEGGGASIIPHILTRKPFRHMLIR